MRHRESILKLGLIAGEPWQGRPHGVYVFNDDYGHPTYSRGRYTCRWSWLPEARSDLFRVAYIGRMMEDEYVENGIVLLDSVPPEHVQLSRVSPLTPGGLTYARLSPFHDEYNPALNYTLSRA